MPLASSAPRAARRRPLTWAALAALAALALVPGCADNGAGGEERSDASGVPTGFTTVVLTTSPSDGTRVEPCCVWLANTPDERRRGLMGVTDLDGAVGMLFAYDEDRTGDFYMYATPMPLSIAFFDGDGTFVSSTDMAPCDASEPADCPRYGAAASYRYALEVPEGELASLGIAQGSSIGGMDGAESTGCNEAGPTSSSAAATAPPKS